MNLPHIGNKEYKFTGFSFQVGKKKKNKHVQEGEKLQI